MERRIIEFGEFKKNFRRVRRIAGLPPAVFPQVTCDGPEGRDGAGDLPDGIWLVRGSGPHVELPPCDHSGCARAIIVEERIGDYASTEHTSAVTTWGEHESVLCTSTFATISLSYRAPISPAPPQLLWSLCAMRPLHPQTRSNLD